MLNNAKRHFVIGFLFILTCPFLFAPTRDIHDGQLLQVLFGRPWTINEKEQTKAEILEKALYLTIDQYQGRNLDYLDDLRKYGVKNLPTREQINIAGGNSSHQRYTHRGWDFSTYSDQSLWEARKQLLLSTLDAIFTFQEHEMIKKNSFGALLYYTHILGDHAGDSKATATDRMRLNGSMRGRNMKRGDIIWELEYHIPRLFREQTDAFEYKMLMKYFARHESQPAFEYSTTISDEDYAQLQSFARDILNKLIENIPPLLKNENFFKRAFL